MDKRTNRILFPLLRSAIRGSLLTEQERELFSEQVIGELVAIAKGHDLSHLLALGIKNNKLSCNGTKELEKEILKAFYRYEQLNHELVMLCDVLEDAQIHFMPLKGSVLRDYYPEPWMRTSCDIDILVNEKDLDRAVDLLVNDHGYIFETKGTHDVSLFSGGNLHLELHYDLIADDVAKQSGSVLSDIWAQTGIKQGKRFWHEMNDEMFYFYHIAHAAKHFEEGGCGIRPMIDLWILDNLEGVDENCRTEMLARGDLLKFSEMARKLSRVWLEGEEHNEITVQMERYILRGGTYGVFENRITVQQQKKGGRFKYAMSRVFIPYDIIKYHYPVLEKHRWLLPFMEVRRWCKLIFCGHAARTVRELQYSNNISREQAEYMQVFLKNIGL